MFIDNVLIEVKAGDGGSGIVSFRREKYIDRGGPNGGDGGDGGDVILVGSDREHTLAKFRYNKLVKADSGKDGGTNNKHGRSAQHLEVAVPVGTQATDLDGNILADITKSGEKIMIAKGGVGGFGNAHFKSSTRQAPNFAEKGIPGQELEVKLELKLIADVALVGLPNAGKSTLLSVISNAKPEIADYPFTTIRPNLGVVDFRERSVLFADIPGLIEGAHEGKGLGHEFLKHVERTKTIVHLIDIYSQDIEKSYHIIRSELKDYSSYLANLPEVIALTKTEGIDASMISEAAAKLQVLAPAGTAIVAISAVAHAGIESLLEAVLANLDNIQKAEIVDIDDKLPVFGIDASEQTDWQIDKKRDRYVITGAKIEHFAHKTYFDDEDSVDRLKDIMLKTGITQDLWRKGYEEGQKVIIGQPEIGRLTF
ncbi:GTPase ObgE [Candidatus Saccharibacteria bacterium]|nr:GTPase ObgE [Candidatus Saccharibacteria bacterium]